MTVATAIEQKVRTELQPIMLQLENESHQHAGRRTDSHFKLVVVAEAFRGLSKVKRHQRIYQVLRQELQGPVHALALHLYTPEEWDQATVPASPLCSSSK